MTVTALIGKYLAWCVKNRSPRTGEWYAGHLGGFLSHIGKLRKKAAHKIRPHHVIGWADSKEGWGDTYKRGAIVAVQRAWNWGVEMGFLDDSPIRKISKPQAKRRDNPMSQEDIDAIFARLRANDPFRELLIFVWQTGCRPQECRHIEARHIELERERIIIPAAEAKGKRYARIIYLHGEALTIIQRLVAQYPEGKLFRNKRGGAWTKYAACNRMHRLSLLTGRKHCLYDSRHGFGMRKLAQGHDHLVIGELMGHKDGSMLAKIYGHMDRNVDRLRKALEN